MTTQATSGLHRNFTPSLLARSAKPTLLLGGLMLTGDLITHGVPGLEGVATSLLGAWILTVILIRVADALPYPPRSVAWVLFLLTYMVMAINVVIELIFFSTTSQGELLSILFANLWQLGPLALMLSRASLNSEPTQLPGEALGRLWAARSALSWAWRVPAAALAFIFVYFVVGAVAYTFTAPYYDDPSIGLNLLVPPLNVIVPLQGGRALLYLLAFAPILAALRHHRRAAAVHLGSVLFVAGALTPLLANTQWPLLLRFYHSVEGFFLGYLGAWAMTWVILPGGNAPALEKDLDSGEMDRDTRRVVTSPCSPG